MGEIPEVGGHGGEKMSRKNENWVAFVLVFYMQGIFISLMVELGRLS